MTTIIAFDKFSFTLTLQPNLIVLIFMPLLF